MSGQTRAYVRGQLGIEHRLRHGRFPPHRRAVPLASLIITLPHVAVPPVRLHEVAGHGLGELLLTHHRAEPPALGADGPVPQQADPATRRYRAVQDVEPGRPRAARCPRDAGQTDALLLGSPGTP